MNKLYIILSVMVLLLISLVSALDTIPPLDDEGWIGVWKFDVANGDIPDLKTNSRDKYDLSCTGVTYQQSAIDSISDFAISHSGSSYCNNSAITNELSNLKVTNWTIISSFFGVGGMADGTPLEFDSSIRYSLNQDSDGTLMIIIYKDSGDYRPIYTVTDPRGKNLLTVLTRSGAITTLYNGTEFWATVEEANHFKTVGSNGLVISCQGDKSTNCLLENSKSGFTAIYNETLNIAQIQDLIDNGIGVAVSETATPTYQPPTPADNSVNTTNQTINCTTTAPTTNLRFFLNVSLEGEFTDSPYIFNETATAEGHKIFETNFTDGVYTYECFLQNITNGIFSNAISRTLTIDTTSPTITFNPTNSFNSNNVAQISQYLNYLFFNLTFVDETELFGVLINITRDGISYFNYSNTSFGVGIGNKTFNYTRNVSTSFWPSGVYTVNISVSDSHTANSINAYDVNNGINTITFNTPEGNRIEISSDGSAYSTIYNKKEDRYEFGWNYLLTDSTRKFTIESDNHIYYLPNSKYIGHFVIVGKNLNGNWIDFEGIGKDYSVKKINDRKYEITFTNIPLTNTIISKSLGGVNKLTETYFWYKGNYTTTAPTTSTFGNTETFTLNITKNNTYALPNATFFYDGTEYLTSSTPSEDYIIFSRDLVITQPPGTSEKINFTWLVNVTQTLNGSYTFNISNSLNISEALVDNCSFYNSTILVISGKDEETDNNVNITLNIVFIPSVGVNNSYELSGSINYSFCSDSDVNFTIDSIMEYGDVTYTDRKYYLNDFQIDTTTTAEVILYHLNNSKASEIVFTVFDTTTGDRVPGAFIKMLRFYPGENIFRIVEISKTDETGQTLGKMVLADVFYKFIIEAPAGTVKLDTDILRILSLTRSFGISFVVDVLDTWTRIYSVSKSLSCTKGTKTCRVTWSDSSNVVQDVTLEVWRITGLSDKMLFSQTVAAAAGTISYTVTEDVAANTYEARAFVESNTGASKTGWGRSRFFYSDNPFFTDEGHRIASLFPLLLLVLVIIFALVDWGVVGIVVGSLLGLIIGSMVGILPLSPFYFISFIIMGVILLYKLSK